VSIPTWFPPAMILLVTLAIVRIAKKLHAMELAKMVGHKDLRMTLNVYYKIDPEEIARKL
jgi:integrase